MIEGDLVFFVVLAVCIAVLVVGFIVHFRAYDDDSDIAIAERRVWYPAAGFTLLMIGVDTFTPVRQNDPIAWALFVPAFVMIVLVGVQVYLFWKEQRPSP